MPRPRNPDTPPRGSGKQRASTNLALYIGLQDLWQTGATGQDWDQRQAAWNQTNAGPFRVPYGTDCP